MPSLALLEGNARNVVLRPLILKLIKDAGMLGERCSSGHCAKAMPYTISSWFLQEIARDAAATLVSDKRFASFDGVIVSCMKVASMNLNFSSPVG